MSVVANRRALRSRAGCPTDAALGGSAALRRVRNEAELASSNIDTWCLPYAALIRRKNRVGTCARECEVAQACSRAHLSPKKMATAKRQRLDELGGEQIDSSNDQTDILDFFVEPVGAKENGDGDDFFEGLAQLEGGEASLGSTPASGPIPGDKPAADPFVASLISNGFNGTAAETGKAPLPDQQPSTAGAAANAALSKTLGTSMIGRGPAPVTTQELETLVSSLPPSYALTTKVDERELHVRLLRQLRADGPAATVLTSWVPTKDAGGRPLLRLHTVFRDRYAATALQKRAAHFFGASHMYPSAPPIAWWSGSGRPHFFLRHKRSPCFFASSLLLHTQARLPRRPLAHPLRVRRKYHRGRRPQYGRRLRGRHVLDRKPRADQRRDAPSALGPAH